MTSRSWCFTKFDDEYGNLDLEGYGDYLESLCTWLDGCKDDRNAKSWRYTRYLVAQFEKCPDTQRIHLQGYAEFSKPIRFSGLRCGCLDGSHFERRRGTRDEARNYCTKEQTRIYGPVEYGEWSGGGQGNRTDLEAIKHAIDEGATELEVAELDFGTYIRYARNLNRYRTLRMPERQSKTRVIIYWGASGTGKTRLAYTRHQKDMVYDLPRPNGGSVWFDGYDPKSHTCVLMDDFYGWVPLHLLLKLGDRYPMRVPIKGGMVNFCPEELIITSNKPYKDWYRWEDFGQVLLQAFERRIDECREFLEGERAWEFFDNNND